MMTISTHAAPGGMAVDKRQRNVMDLLFKPKSVAIVGASDDPGRLSGLPIAYLKEAGFEGVIWPVNPNRSVVQGLKAYPSVGHLPEAPDVAIIVVHIDAVLGALSECARTGVGAVMVFTTGFGEAGEEGERAQEEMLRIVRESGMRVLGPNCLGCFNSAENYYGTFAIALAQGFAVPGNVAVVSQSGAYGEQVCYLARKRGLGVRYFVNTGNEVDINAGEVIAWLAEQPEIDVILAYAEGTRDPEGFRKALALAHANGKKVVFLKVGRSESGAATAASHTAALVGDDAVWDAVLSKYGVFRAESTEEQIDVAYAAARGILPGGRKIGILTVSGGFGAQLADAADRFGLDTPPLPGDVTGTLAELLPFGSIANPLDASGQVVAHIDRLSEALDVMANKSGYDAVVLFLGTVSIAPSMAPALIEGLLKVAPRVGDRPVALVMILEDEEFRKRLSDAGYLVFSDSYAAMAALAGLSALADGRSRGVISVPLPDSVALGPGPLSEFSANHILGEAGIPVLPQRLCRTVGEAVAAANEIDGPVVLKIVSPQIVHKTEIGGVLLNLADEDAVRDGFDLLIERGLAAGLTEDAIEGVIVAPMASKGLEVILGARIDPTFGPVVVFGLGGTLVEVVKDVSIRAAPIDPAEAREMVRELRTSSLFDGVRGAGPADMDCLGETISNLSRFAAANAQAISSVEINPFVVWEQGQGGVALDAVITLVDDASEDG